MNLFFKLLRIDSTDESQTHLNQADFCGLEDFVEVDLEQIFGSRVYYRNGRRIDLDLNPEFLAHNKFEGDIELPDSLKQQTGSLGNDAS